MNLQAYANHRKTLGLRGTSHVAVLNAINDGRLSEPAVQRQGRSWVINPDLADEQWASRTDPSERGAMGIYAPRTTERKPVATATADPPAAVKGGPPLAVSKQVKAAYEAKLAELDYKERSGEMVNMQDVRKEAARLARQVRDLLLIIPSRNAAKVAVMSDTEEIRSLLQAEIESALRGLVNA